MADDEDSRLVLRRKDAISLGLNHYFTGKPCKNGHVAKRRVVSKNCVKCAYDSAQSKGRSYPAIEAKKAGLHTYLTGIPCKNGHVSRRWVESHKCIACDAMWKKSWKKRNPEGAKAIKRRSWEQQRNRPKTEEYRRAFNERHRLHEIAKRARLRAADGFHTSDDIAAIRKAQRGKCAYCKRNLGDEYHVDHIIPLSKGGYNWPSNLQLTCGPCNMSKSAKDPIEFAQSRGLLL